jgi:hypothetical protein
VLVWRGLETWRAEYADVSVQGERLTASGVQLGVDPRPYRLTYDLDTAAGFLTVRLAVQAQGDGWSRRLDLRRAPDGSWTLETAAEGADDLGAPGGDPDALEGATDCDLGFSPLTNTMPILRDGGGPGGYVMAWVSVPDLGVHRLDQRYEPLDDGRIRYSDDDFVRDLTVGPDGFVTHYPGLGELVQG